MSDEEHYEPAVWGPTDEDTLSVIVEAVHPLTRRAFPLDLTILWSWYATIKTFGFDQAYGMATAALLVGDLDELRLQVRWMLEAIQAHGDAAPDKLAQAVEISYLQTISNTWTSTQAHRFAQTVVDPAITAHAWRRRIYQFAKDRALPRKPRGRPTKPK